MWILFSSWRPCSFPGSQPTLPHAACCSKHLNFDDDDDAIDDDVDGINEHYYDDSDVEDDDISGDLLLCLHAPSCLSNQCNCLQSLRFIAILVLFIIITRTLHLLLFITILNECNASVYKVSGFYLKSHDSVQFDPLWYQLLWGLQFSIVSSKKPFLAEFAETGTIWSYSIASLSSPNSSRWTW